MNPDSSAKTTWAPSRAAFFYSRPVLLFPPSDGLLIALNGAGLRLLMAPVETVHEPPDMVAVIVHAKLLLDEFGDEGGRSKIGAVAAGQRPLQHHQAALLGWLQLHRASWRRPDLQRLRSTSPPGIEPTHHGNGRTLNTPSDLIEGEVGLEQSQRSLAPVFEEIGATLQSGHRCWLLHVLLHSSCRSQ